ncbi:7934_t:CDS:2 [Diversispora eburnea]|uniref:7934_t:CDS:1 n=1 Tax=Diversispora eburnea TaxID=1213867 RepID=A0A9N8ZE76_9GLOM|nr:7934_t:CDS:2 [Diversispora eburnea]
MAVNIPELLETIKIIMAHESPWISNVVREGSVQKTPIDGTRERKVRRGEIEEVEIFTKSSIIETFSLSSFENDGER